MRHDETAAPIVRIAAPPGTGKTTVLPHLVALARGRAVVADIDEILDDGRLLGVMIADQAAAPIWPAYDRLWERIAGFATRAGFPVLLLVQVPGPGDPGGPGELLGWEIDADARAERLRHRGETDDVIADARADADQLRAMLPDGRLVRTAADAAPDAVAQRLWSAAERHFAIGAA